ncbi:MAG: hypothetical protein ABR583_10655 [Gaiellaceae bacterium]
MKLGDVIRRLSSGGGVNVAKDVNAVVSANVGESRGSTNVASSRRSTRIVQRDGETTVYESDSETYEGRT